MHLIRPQTHGDSQGPSRALRGCRNLPETTPPVTVTGALSLLLCGFEQMCLDQIQTGFVLFLKKTFSALGKTKRPNIFPTSFARGKDKRMSPTSSAAACSWKQRGRYVRPPALPPAQGRPWTRARGMRGRRLMRAACARSLQAAAQSARTCLRERVFASDPSQQILFPRQRMGF